MKNKTTKKIDYFTIFLQIVFFLNFVINLAMFIVEGKTFELTILILYGLGFLVTSGFLLFTIFAYRKWFAVSVNKVYYAYSQNIVSESTFIEEKKLRAGKLEKISTNKIIEYRKIDNFYVTQKIGLVNIDDNRDLIVFYKSEFKNDFAKSLFKDGLDNYEANKEVFFDINNIKDLDGENVLYSSDKLKGVVINSSDGFTITEYNYSFNSPESKLEVALEKCAPHWDLNLEQDVTVYETIEEAKEKALEIIDNYHKKVN